MKVACSQSNYLPWKGYFDMIARADLFIFYDDVQYTRYDWRNRNRIKTHKGLQWLSVPCSGHTSQRICDVSIVQDDWQERHWRTIVYHYHNTPYFEQYRAYFESIYLEQRWESLSKLNQETTRHIAENILGITTRFDDSRNYVLTGKKRERAMSLVDQLENLDEYIMGPAAQNYIDPPDFEKRKIKLSFMDYTGYPEYPQPHKPFVHEVSILDLIFNTGPKAPEYMKYVKKDLGK